MIKADEYYSLKELTSELKTDRRTIQNKLEGQGGNIPYLKVGNRGQYRILGQDVLSHFGSASYSQPQEERTEGGVKTNL